MPTPTLNSNNNLWMSLLAFSSDLILWFVLTLVVVGITTLFDMDAKQLTKHKTTIMLTLQDAYSLSKGSMVRLMGVPIGYIDNVKLAPNNSVIVLLKLNPEIPSLPTGAKGTVVAYGLGGSKSLDFDLPNTTEKQAGNGREAVLSVSNPLRQKALLQAQIEVAKTLEAGANSLADSLSHFPTIQQQGNIAKVRVDSFNMIKGQEAFIQSLINFQQKLSAGAHSAKTLVDTFSSSTDKTDHWVSLYSPKIRTLVNRPPTFPSLQFLGEAGETGRSLQGIAQGIQAQAKGLQFELKPLHTKLQQLEGAIQKLNTSTATVPPSTSTVGKLKIWQKTKVPQSRVNVQPFENGGLPTVVPKPPEGEPLLIEQELALPLPAEAP
jgi:ABC-type transporter Mla subunit MlaD